MKNLIIIGAGGHGKVAADIAKRMRRWDCIEFYDDNENIKEIMGIKVYGKTEDAAQKITEAEIFIAIGRNDIRQKMQKSLEAEGAKIPVLIHPNSVVGSDVKLGNGTVVMAGTVINCCTEIGKGCIVNTGATVDHDCILEDYVHICPGAHIAGTVKIGTSTWVGLGSTVSNDITICNSAFIGAGAVVIKNITQSGTYVGCPAKKLD